VVKKKEFVVVIDKTVPVVEVLCGLSNEVKTFSSRREAIEFMRGFSDQYRIEAKASARKEIRQRVSRDLYKVSELVEALESIRR